MPPFDSEQELPLKNGQKKKPLREGPNEGLIHYVYTIT